MQEEFFLFCIFSSPVPEKLPVGGKMVSRSSRPQTGRRYDRFSGYLRDKKSHRVRARRREKSSIVFSEDMRLGKNTAQTASVQLGLSRGQAVHAAGGKPLASEGEAFGGRENARVRGKCLPKGGKVSTIFLYTIIGGVRP